MRASPRTVAAVFVMGHALAAVRPAAGEDDAVVRAARAHVRTAQEARKAGRPLAVLDALLQAYALRPHHAGIALELAAAYAATGRLDDAAAQLRLVTAMGIPLPVAGRGELEACRTHAACGAALAAFAGLDPRKATSTVAFTFARPGLIPEGLADDPATGAFFVSSVRRRTILRVHRSGRVETFAGRAAGLLAPLGITVDPGRGFLWVATAALPEMEGAVPDDEGRSALVALDLRSGRMAARYELPRDRPHALGDVILGPSGELFATDSLWPAVYRLSPGSSSLVPLAAGEPFVSPQGLALSADGTRLFVADYSKGVFAIDIATRRVRLLEAPPTAAILGIDGIYRAGETLLAVQNGVDPARLLRLTVTGDALSAVEVVDAAHPSFADPTLGVVTGGSFYYIANSQWGAAKPGGEMDPAVRLQDPVILTLPLASAR